MPIPYHGRYIISVILSAVHKQKALRFHVKTERISRGSLRGKRPREWLGRKGERDVKKAVVIVLLILSVVIVSLLIARCPIGQTLIAPP